MSDERIGLVYVARVKFRNDFAIGVTSYATGEFIPYRGYLGGGAIYGHGIVVHDRTRPVFSEGWKVGFTTNLRLRAVSLAGESCGPVDIVALRAGPRSFEVAAHRELRACGAMLAPEGPRGLHRYGCAREWYRDSDEFRAWLDAFDASWRGSIVYLSYSGKPMPSELTRIESILVGATS